MSFLVKQTACLSMSNKEQILEITLTEIHLRVEVTLGSKNDVKT